MNQAQEATAPVTSRRWMIILISAAVAFYWASLYFYVPTLPVYAQSKTTDLATVGVVLAMYGLWQGILRLPLGIASDWIGRRKPFLYLGFVLCALGAWIMGTSTGPEGLILGRAITGLAAATWVPLTVLFSSQFPPEESVRAASLLTLTGSLSRMIATGTTGTLNEMGGYPLAFTVSIGAAVLALVVTLPVREAARPPRRPSGKRLLALLTSKAVLIPALLSVVAQWISWSSTFGFLPVLARGLGATGQTQSVLMSMNLGLGLAGNLITTALARRANYLALIYASFVILCGGMVIAGLGSSLVFVFIGQALLGLGEGICAPLLMGMTIRQVSEQERTSAMGLYQAVYAIGMFGGPWLSGIIADQTGIPVMFIGTGIVTFVLGILGAQFLKDRE